MAKENMVMQVVEWLALVLVGIGAINWGLTVFGFNLVEWLATALGIAILAKILYAIVGLSGVYYVTYVARKEILEGPMG